MEQEVEKKEEIEMEIKKPVSKKVVILNVLIIVAIFVALIIYMVMVDGIDNIIQIIKTIDYRWFFAGIGVLLLHWACEAYTLHLPIKRMYPKQSFLNSIKVSMIGQMGNNITPFSSGGQAIQAYYFTQTGKRISDSLSAMVLKFIITQTALVITTAAVVILEFDFFANLMQDYIWVAVAGFAVNILAIVIVILAGVKKKVITIITTPIIKLLGKIRILKRPEEKIEKLDKSIDNFGKQFIIMKSEKLMVFKMFMASVVQSLAYYSITYMVYRAFGNSGISFLQVIPLQALLLLIMTFIPTPGSGLGAEGGFYLLFNSIFKEGTIHISILFWRIYTFYLPIIVGALFLIPTRGRMTKAVAITEEKEQVEVEVENESE